MYYPSPEYLKRATKKCTPLVTETGFLNSDMNISSTVNLLIQNTGRFVESYAGDLLINLAHVYAMVRKHNVELKGESVVIGFGMRRQGVDHNAFIMNRLSETAKSNPFGYVSVEKYYRKVFVVTIDNEPAMGLEDTKCIVQLFDVTDHLDAMSESDMNWNPDEDVKAHYTARPECSDEEKFNHWASYEQEIINKTKIKLKQEGLL